MHWCDRMFEKRKADTSRTRIENSRTLQIWHRRITISSGQRNTYLQTRTSPVTKKSKTGWMNGSSRKTTRSIVVGLPYYQRYRNK